MRGAAIYLRISKLSAAEKRELGEDGLGLGVRRQEEDDRELCHQLGYSDDEIEVYVDDDTSATNLSKPRKEYKRLLEDIRARRMDLLVSWHPDRLHRQPSELEDFIKIVDPAGLTNIRMVRAGLFDLSTASGKLVARILGGQARFQVEHMIEQVQRKHQQLARDGKPGGKLRSFGYEYDPRTRGLVVIETEAVLVREAAQRVLGGESLAAVCRDWGARGIRTIRGNEYSVTSLRYLLASARISGRRDYAGSASNRPKIARIVGKAVWDEIITPAESDRLRALLGAPERRSPGRTGEYLLTGGIARCGLCGAALQSHPQGQRNGEPYRTLACMVETGRPDRSGCGKVRVVAEPLEALITKAVLKRVGAGELEQLLNQQDDGEDLAAQLAEIEARLQEAGRRWAAGDTFAEAARADLHARQHAISIELEKRRRILSLDDLPADIAGAWLAGEIPLHKRRAIVSFFLESVVVNPSTGRGRFDSDRVDPRWKR